MRPTGRARPCWRGRALCCREEIKNGRGWWRELERLKVKVGGDLVPLPRGVVEVRPSLRSSRRFDRDRPPIVRGHCTRSKRMRIGGGGTRAGQSPKHSLCVHRRPPPRLWRERSARDLGENEIRQIGAQRYCRTLSAVRVGLRYSAASHFQERFPLESIEDVDIEARESTRRSHLDNVAYPVSISVDLKS